jgi:hypothetical protein
MVMKLSIVLLLLLFCLGCNHRHKIPDVHISLINNNRSVKFKGLDYAVISEINRDSVQGIWQGLLPVFRMPADTDLKNYQQAQPGIYRVKDSAVVFTPDTPFVKGQIYYMRYYQFDDGQTVWDFIKDEKRPGSKHYIDLIFK